jgi:hypothetical protein
MTATAHHVKPRFLVAKFVPDLRRQEPRNVGVILLHPSGIYSRFFGEVAPDVDDANDLALSKKKMRERLTDTYAYEQWVDHWRYSINEYLTIEEMTSSSEIEKKFEACEKRLFQDSHQHYLVMKGGQVLQPGFEQKDPNVLLTHLYNILVEEDETTPVDYVDLRTKAENVLVKAGVYNHALLQKEISIDTAAPRGKHKSKVKPAYLFQTSKYYSVLEIVPLHASSKKLAQRAVDATQFMFERLDRHARNVNKSTPHFYSFLDGRRDHYSYDPTEFFETLTEWGHTVDVGSENTEKAERLLRELLNQK